jgi:preprotein translocase subunit SecE
MAKDLEEKDELDTTEDEESSDVVDAEEAADDAADEADERTSSDEIEAEASEDDAEDEDEERDGTTPANVGAALKYVHAAFFSAGILIAYLSSKVLAAAWNELAEWPTATRALPQLLRYAEDDRANIMLAVGAAVGIVAVVQTYRKELIRRWADEVASELAKVTWPTRDIVTNGTIVVVVASFIATAYIGVLDRLWGFLTNLVYGA